MFKKELSRWSNSKAYKNDKAQVEIGRIQLYKLLAKQDEQKLFDFNVDASYHDQKYDINEVYGQTGDQQPLSTQQINEAL